MKQYLLPENGRFYKANLHSHSTVSDGERTPEELKAMYKARGYSVFAYTDHDNFVTHNELTDDEFLVINGHEASASSLNSVILSPRETSSPRISTLYSGTLSGRRISTVARSSRDAYILWIFCEITGRDSLVLTVIGAGRLKNKKREAFCLPFSVTRIFY